MITTQQCVFKICNICNKHASDGNILSYTFVSKLKICYEKIILIIEILCYKYNVMMLTFGLNSIVYKAGNNNNAELITDVAVEFRYHRRRFADI